MLKCIYFTKFSDCFDKSNSNMLSKVGVIIQKMKISAVFKMLTSFFVLKIVFELERTHKSLSIDAYQRFLQQFSDEKFNFFPSNVHLKYRPSKHVNIYFSNFKLTLQKIILSKVDFISKK